MCVLPHVHVILDTSIYSMHDGISIGKRNTKVIEARKRCLSIERICHPSVKSLMAS